MIGANLLVFIVIALALSGAVIITKFLQPQRSSSLRTLSLSGASGSHDLDSPLTVGDLASRSRVGDLILGYALVWETKNRIDVKLFHAGFFSARSYGIFRVSQVVCASFLITLGVYLSPNTWIMFASILLMGLLGIRLPFMYLDRVVNRRAEDIMFHLPLVIEQLVIGVSGSLDIGPCIQRVVAMADERDSHNSVTELLRYVEQLVRTGVSFEESLEEVGNLSGHTELKHAFMSLGQVFKHGGEVSKQLQELADAVAAQREVRVETRIKKLELKATAPLGLVFACFMAVLLVGIGIRLMNGFK